MTSTGVLKCTYKTSILKMLLLILVISLTLTGCPFDMQKKELLRIGTNVWPGYEPLYLAREQGYFPKETIKLVEFLSSSDTIRALRNGTIQCAALTLDETIILRESIPDLRIILVLDISNGADVILAKPDIQNLRDLKGRRVGVEATALGAFFLTRALQTVGMTYADVAPVSIGASEHERAFLDGRVDAVVTFGPARTRILKSGARILFDSSRIPGEIVDVLVVRQDLIKNGKEIKDIVLGWFKALDFINMDRRRAAAVMAQREGISIDDFLMEMRGLRLADREENMKMLTGANPSLIPVARQLGRLMLANGLIVREPELEKALDGSHLKGAIR